MRATSTVSSVLVVCLLGACSKSPPAPGAVADAAAPPPTASASAGPVVPRPASELTVVARSAGPMRLFALGEATFVSAGRLLYRADDRGLHQEIALMRGFGGAIADVPGKGGQGYEVMGFWPDGAWLVAAARDGAADGPVITVATYRWVKDRWRRAPLLQPNEMLQGLARWRKGTALALIAGEGGARLGIVNDRGFLDVQPTPTPWARARLAADAGADAAEIAAAPSEAEAPDGATTCMTELRGLGNAASLAGGERASRALLAFEDGALFMAGTSCVDGDARWLVERWDPKTRRSTIDDVPKPADAAMNPNLVLAAPSPTDAWLMARGGSSLLHFDGKAWKAEALSGAERFVDFAVSAQGTAWLTTADALMRRENGAWQRVELPKDEGQTLVPLEVVPSRDERIWVRARAGQAEVLLASGIAAPAPTRLPDTKDAIAASGDILRFPASTSCDAPYVLLVEHVKPTETKFPEAVAALKGVAGVELVTESSQKWTYLGARVTSMQDASKVADLGKAIPGAKPAIYCHEPKVAKRISLE